MAEDIIATPVINKSISSGEFPVCLRVDCSSAVFLINVSVSRNMVFSFEESLKLYIVLIRIPLKFSNHMVLKFMLMKIICRICFLKKDVNFLLSESTLLKYLQSIATIKNISKLANEIYYNFRVEKGNLKT
jgi:hypothetical protein